MRASWRRALALLEVVARARVDLEVSGAEVADLPYVTGEALS